MSLTRSEKQDEGRGEERNREGKEMEEEKESLEGVEGVKSLERKRSRPGGRITSSARPGRSRGLFFLLQRCCCTLSEKSRSVANGSPSQYRWRTRTARGGWEDVPGCAARKTDDSGTRAPRPGLGRFRLGERSLWAQRSQDFGRGRIGER